MQRGGKAGLRGARAGAGTNTNYRGTAAGQALEQVLASFGARALAHGEGTVEQAHADQRVWDTMRDMVLQQFDTAFSQVFKDLDLHREMTVSGDASYRSVDGSWMFVVQNPTFEGGDADVHTPVVVIVATEGSDSSAK